MSNIKNKKLHKFISIAVVLAIVTVIITSLLAPGLNAGMVLAEILFGPLYLSVIIAVLIRLYYLKSGKGKFGTYFGYTISVLIIISSIFVIMLAIFSPEELVATFEVSPNDHSAGNQ